jgi:ABC-type transporter Mla MlaB component
LSDLNPEGMSVAQAGGIAMLRISKRAAADENAATCLRLEGQVTGPWVEELRRVVTEAAGSNGHTKGTLVIDLAGVSFLDADGLALFHELATRRARFTNCSSFVAEQLRGVANVDS